MAKEKVTLTIDAEVLDDLRKQVGRRSLSSTVETAVTIYVERLHHLAAVDDWLADMERHHGPIPPETLEWAAELIEDWEAGKGSRSSARRAS